jgi:hypothetical protein
MFCFPFQFGKLYINVFLKHGKNTKKFKCKCQLGQANKKGLVLKVKSKMKWDF